MISVGMRPPEEELFGKQPVEPIANLPLKENPVMIPNGKDSEANTGRINRMVLSRSAVVELLHIESPSRIWVRLPNHITDSQLTIKEPYELMVPKKFEIGQYMIAPGEGRTFRRCRILNKKRTEDDKIVVQIFYIDDATTVWVSANCLRDIEENLMFYPWQAIQISMFGVYPSNLSSNKNRITWNTDVVVSLRNIMELFPYFKIDIVISSVAFNDYAREIPCRIFGVHDEYDTRKAINIASLLISNCPSMIVEMTLNDSALHKIFECDEDQNDKISDRRVPDGWLLRGDMEEDSENYLNSSKNLEDWDPVLCQIPMFTKETFFSFVDSSNCIMMSVEGSCTKSPYEFYARPIQKTWTNKMGETVTMETKYLYDESELQLNDEVQWMIDGNNHLTNFAEQLDTYYSDSKHRKPFHAEEIKELLKCNNVYAVCAVNEEKAMYTGEWQRVQIINCETFAEVRFVDSGGRDIVLTSSLYKIHKQHCRQPPKCLHLAMHGVRSSNTSFENRWQQTENSSFSLILKEDVPIVVNFDDIEKLNESSNDWRHVFFIKDFTPYGEQIGAKELFVKSINGGGILDSSMPMEWIDRRSYWASKLDMFRKSQV